MRRLTTFLCLTLAVLLGSVRIFGCITTKTVASPRLRAAFPYMGKKDIIVTFPAWTTEEKKREELRERAKPIALSKCRGEKYKLSGVISEGIDFGSPGHLSFIAADILCPSSETESFAQKSPPPIQEKEEPKQVIKKPTPKPSRESGTTLGSGFFVSKMGHVITNQHVVSDCIKVTVGDNSKRQVTAGVLETDRRNDLALLLISSMQTASDETKSLIRKLDIKVVPLASHGLMRSEDVELGERVMVAGYPYGEIFSDTIKVTGGIVSAIRGMGDDSGQFQIDAAVQPGNSGGPIYDENGNIVGVVIAQLNKLKMAKTIGSLPENVNFGIKASTVKQFLTSSGLPTKWSKRSKSMSTREIAKIAKSQTVMVVCHQ